MVAVARQPVDTCPQLEGVMIPYGVHGGTQFVIFMIGLKAHISPIQDQMIRNFSSGKFPMSLRTMEAINAALFCTSGRSQIISNRM